MYGVVTVQRAKAKSARGFEILPFETSLKLINGKATITEAETDGTGPFYDSVYLFRVQNGYCAPRWGFMAALPDGTTPITTGELPMVDPITGEGIYMDAQEWNELYGDLPSRVSGLETGKSNVGHTHTQVENGPGVVRVNNSGGIQHLVNDVVVTEFNSLGEMSKGTVSKIGRLTKEMRFDAVGRLQYFDTATSTILFQISPNGQITIGEVPWARVTGAPTTTAWSSITGIPEGLEVSDTSGPIGPLTALLAHANTRTVPLFFIGSSTTGRVAYPTGVTKRLANAYPSGGAEYGTVYARNPLTVTHTGPGVAGYNGGIGGTTSSNYLTTDVLNNIALTQPIAVFHGIGSNDWANNVNPATYEANVRASIASIDAVITKPHVHILMQQHTRPGTRTYAWDEYSVAMRRIADDADNRVFIDLGPAIDTTDPFGVDPFGFGEGDGTHLNAAGEDVLGELMTRALGVPGGTGAATPSAASTKWRDISALCTEATFGAGGGAFLKRTGETVWLTLINLISTNPGTDNDVDLITMMGGFRPVKAAFGDTFAGNVDNGRVQVSGGTGVVTIYNMPEGRAVNGSLSWPTEDAVPTTLPGVAV